MTPSWRKPAGVLAILAIITIWAVLVASLSSLVGGWHWTAQALFYLVAGLAWITPMKPLLRWMETGRWRWGRSPCRSYRRETIRRPAG